MERIRKALSNVFIACCAIALGVVIAILLKPDPTLPSDEVGWIVNSLVIVLVLSMMATSLFITRAIFIIGVGE